jgi:hypothetical protein
VREIGRINRPAVLAVIVDLEVKHQGDHDSQYGRRDPVVWGRRSPLWEMLNLPLDQVFHGCGGSKCNRAHSN